jgi:hypothetical protein
MARVWITRVTRMGGRRSGIDPGGERDGHHRDQRRTKNKVSFLHIAFLPPRLGPVHSPSTAFSMESRSVGFSVWSRLAAQACHGTPADTRRDSNPRYRLRGPTVCGQITRYEPG